MDVFEKIEAQQKGKEGTAPWMVGEQLKEIIRGRPDLEELVSKDLDSDAMSLDAAEGQIHNYADKHKKGRCACVPPNVAEDIIRKFYGLPDAAAEEEQPLRLVEPKPEPVDELDGLNLADFML